MPRTRIAPTGSLGAAAVLLALAACGGPGNVSNGSAAATGTVASAPGGWKATDACAMLDKGVVTATLGSAVQSAELSAVKDQGGGFPLYSQCAYTLADGRMLVFGAGENTNGASLADQIQEMRRQAVMVTDKQPVDVSGIGKAGLWAAEVGSLYAFLGKGRFVSASVTQPDFRKKSDPIEKVKADDMAILRKVGA